MKKIPIAALLLLTGAIAYTVLLKQEEGLPVTTPAEENGAIEECADQEDDFSEEEEEFADGKEEEEICACICADGPDGQPTIVDFVNALLTIEDLGESLGEMSSNWEKYLRGQPLQQGRSFILDKENNYMRYDMLAPLTDNSQERKYIEFCVWDCTDSRYRLIVANQANFIDDKPFDGQFGGLTFYKYNVATKKLTWTSAYNLHGKFYMPQDTEAVVHNLLYREKSVKCECHTHTGIVIMHLNWDGSKFEWVR